MDVSNKIALLKHIREHVSPQLPSNEGFSLKPRESLQNSSENKNIESNPLLVAQADQPSAKQKEQACLSMLNEARATIDALHGSLSVMSAADIEDFRKNPDSNLVLTDRIDEASAKLDTIREQCGDVLPAGAMEELGELEKKLNDVRDLLFDKNVSGADFLEIAGQVLQAVGEGLSTVATGVALMLRMILGPRQPQTNGGGGLLVAQGEGSTETQVNQDIPDNRPHRGSGR